MANENKWNQQWVNLLAQNEHAAFSWYQTGKRTAREIALPSLKQQTESHCSFCDAFPVEDVSLETVEHFRPKCRDRFPEHAFTWSNLYYCCSGCQAHKGNKWDLSLLAFDDAEYRFSKYFEFDFTTGEIRPSSQADPALKQRAEVTIAIYGLDTPQRRRWRRLELKKWSHVPKDKRLLTEFAYRQFLEPT